MSDIQSGCKDACRLLPLIVETRQVLEAFERVDMAHSQAVLSGRDTPDEQTLKAQVQRLHQRRLAIESHASFVEAESPAGALYQLGLLADVVEALSECALSNSEGEVRFATDRHDAAKRLIGSLAGHMIASSGVKPDDGLGRFYLPAVFGWPGDTSEAAETVA